MRRTSGPGLVPGAYGQEPCGVLKVGKTFKQAAELFLQEYEVINRRRTPSEICGPHSGGCGFTAPFRAARSYQKSRGG